MLPKWQVFHSTRLFWCGWGVCASRDEDFLHIPVTEIQAALPSTSKPDEVPSKSRKVTEEIILHLQEIVFTVFFNKTCLGCEKYQSSRAYLLSASQFKNRFSVQFNHLLYSPSMHQHCPFCWLPKHTWVDCKIHILLLQRQDSA